MAYTPQTSRRKVYPHGTRGPRQDRVKDDAFLGTLKIALEGLFGDANWSTDEAFKSLADSKGWIPLVRLIQLPVIMALFPGTNPSIPTIQHALKVQQSKLIQVHRNGSCLRRYPLNHRIRSHFEFLFGDENYFRDLELQFMGGDSSFVLVADLISRKELGDMLTGVIDDPSKAVRRVETSLSDSVLLELKEPGTPELAVRRRTLAARVVRQVEFYLSKEHLQHDGYLNELMAENESGWIRLADLLAFPRMKTLCLPQVSAVARVLTERSKNVECGPNFTVRPTWYAKEHGLSDESASEPELDEAPPLSPMLPWFPDKATSDFRVMTWNVLADFLTRPQIFPYCQPASLQWNYRRSLIVSEVARTRPSVICLQELQGIGPGGPERADHYTQVAAELAELGYEGVYLRKDMSGPMANLGNAVFWMRDSWQVEKQYQISYSQAIGMRCTTDASKWYFGSPQVAVVVFLRHVALKKSIVVVTTHISCAWESPVKQLAQVQELLLQLAQIVPPTTPMILAGDFNSLPGSGAYRLITERALSMNDAHAFVSPEDQNIGVRLPYPMLAHEFKLESAYRTIYGKEPMFTNFTAQPRSFSGTLDYIFFSPDRLVAKSVLALPSFDYCRKETALPSSVYPSDHLPLTACFSFK